MLATASAAGGADASPKGDPAGDLVHVIDERTIALAERPGNRRADGYRNILENPHVGLLFVIPGRGDTLRINGRARLVSDAPFFDDLVVKGHRPLLALVVEIDEVFHHCAKAFMRSSLWDPDTWDPEIRVPRRAVLAQSSTGRRARWPSSTSTTARRTPRASTATRSPEMPAWQWARRRLGLDKSDGVLREPMATSGEALPENVMDPRPARGNRRPVTGLHPVIEYSFVKGHGTENDFVLRPRRQRAGTS